jgi:hypothetical protein
MMENESLRGPKSTTVIFLWLLLVCAVVWGIVATAIAMKRTKECEMITQEKDQIKLESDQKLAEAQRRVDESEKVRQTALAEMRRHQLQIQDEMAKKAQAEAAAKAAATKAATNKAPAGKTDKKVTKPGAPTKKIVKKPTP